jgi:rhodanese-related sulfurtransferase
MNNAITVMELAERKKMEHAPHIIDVRTRNEYDQGHLEGVVHIDISSPTFIRDIQALSKSDSYILYCATGGRSALAVSFMQDNGFIDVCDLAGGIDAWCRAGFPVEREQ